MPARAAFIARPGTVLDPGSMSVVGPDDVRCRTGHERGCLDGKPPVPEQSIGSPPRIAPATAVSRAMIVPVVMTGQPPLVASGIAARTPAPAASVTRLERLPLVSSANEGSVSSMSRQVGHDDQGTGGRLRRDPPGPCTGRWPASCRRSADGARLRAPAGQGEPWASLSRHQRFAWMVHPSMRRPRCAMARLKFRVDG
jgi:hypothetical protein